VRMLSARSRAFVSDDTLGKMIDANISLCCFSTRSTDMIDPRIYKPYSILCLLRSHRLNATAVLLSGCGPTSRCALELWDKRVRFMTLTSSPSSSWNELNSHFQVLRERIARAFGKLDYIKFRTNEGYGVLHVVYVGSFVPQKWLSRNWQEIHGAKIVDVREVRGEKRLARYLISNYLVSQAFVRMSWSWGWVFRGFVGAWKHFVKKFGYPLCIKRWTSFLSSRILFWKQKGLFPNWVLKRLILGSGASLKSSMNRR